MKKQGFSVEFKDDQFVYEFHHDNKFYMDVVHIENDDYTCCIDGPILNSSELLSCDNLHSIKDYVIENIEDELFWSKLRGKFCGFVFYKKERKAVFFTDHLAQRRLFYQKVDNRILISTDLKFISDNQNTFLLDNESIKQYLIWGFMLENNTLIKDISRCRVGEYIKVSNNNLSVNKFFDIEEESFTDLSESDILSKLDLLFKNAIKRQFDKDIEYGYRHFGNLSGGLDSRMTIGIAHKLGYKDITVNTFASRFSGDASISFDIAEKLNLKQIFFPLVGNNIYNMHDCAKLNQGLALSIGASHSLSSLDMINIDKFGLVHTGQIGDAVLGGAFIKKPYHEKAYNHTDGAYNGESSLNMKSNYSNLESYLMSTRALQGALNGDWMTEKYTYGISPFLDFDFFMFTRKIHPKYKYKHKLYFKWLISYYPELASFKYESLMARISKYSFINRINFYKKIAIFKFRQIVFKKSQNMNPYNMWLNNNKDLKNYYTVRLDEAYGALTKLFQNEECLKIINRTYKSQDIVKQSILIGLYDSIIFLKLKK